MRWPEIICSILTNQGHTIAFNGENGQWDGRQENISVDGLPLDEFISLMQIDKHALLKDNVFLITRMFDQRVKSFVNHILNAGGKDGIKVEHYTYRIEMQMRGAPHVHGCIWLEQESINEYLLKDSKHEFDTEKVPGLIDKLISCQYDDTDQELNKILQEVQVHRHTKSCKKYDNTCRFGYPRFPSKKTLIATPLPADMDDDQAKTKKKKGKEILEKVKGVLEAEDLDEKLTIDELLKQVDISLDDYEEALMISETGSCVIHKREVKERFLNNHNPEYTKAWNGNTDVQFCYDHYAVVTYICDYYGKDESGMTDFLQEALKQNKGVEEKDKLKALKMAYLTHRQIGAAEAIYRILPSLHLKDSNVKCIFVATGFPENRSQFMRKVSDDNEEEEENKDEEKEAVKVEGRQGKFKQSITIHERYAARPKQLENMFLAKFAISYSSTPNRPKKAKFEDGVSGEGSLVGEDLPKYLDLGPKLGVMSLRTKRCVLRLHSSKKKDENHEFYYAEMMLYMPWRDEILDLCRESSKDCQQKYQFYLETICKNKEEIFPFSDSIEEMRKQMEEMSFTRPIHIGDQLDSAAAQGEMDDLEEAELNGNEFSAIHPGEFEKEPETRDERGSRSGIFLKVIPNDFIF